MVFESNSAIFGWRGLLATDLHGSVGSAKEFKENKNWDLLLKFSLRVSQVMEIKNSCYVSDPGSYKLDCSKGKTSTWKMEKLDDMWTFLFLFLLWFVPFTHFSSLLHSATHRNKEEKHWQIKGNTGQDLWLLHILLFSFTSSYLSFFPPWTLQLEQKWILLNLLKGRKSIKS